MRRRCCSPTPRATARPPAAFPTPLRPKAKRVEVRFPDPMANPYLGFAAMLMAGLDGIKNKLDPGPAMDKDLYDLPKEELKEIPTVCGSLREALENLDKDRAFLKAGGVFDDDFIDSLYRTEDDRGRAFRDDPAPGRVRHVLFAVKVAAGSARRLHCRKNAKGASDGSAFRFATLRLKTPRSGRRRDHLSAVAQRAKAEAIHISACGGMDCFAEPVIGRR